MLHSLDIRFFLAPCLLLAACGGAQNNEQSATDARADEHAPGEGPLGPFERRFLPEEEQLVITSDINLDGTPDVFEYYRVLTRTGTTVTDFEGLNPYESLDMHIQRKEFDMNFDGRFDVIRTYNVSQELAREQLDVNLDGRFDFINHYEDAQLTRRQIDEDGDGEFEQTRIYQDGQLYRVEIDTNADFLPDRWEFYLGSTLDRIGYDDSGNGVIDRWVMAERSNMTEIADAVSDEVDAHNGAVPDAPADSAEDAATEDAATEDAPAAE